MLSDARFLSLLEKMLRLPQLATRKENLLRCICDKKYTPTDDGELDSFDPDWDRKFIYDHFYGAAARVHSHITDGVAAQQDDCPPDII